jgi:hypothetical protein
VGAIVEIHELINKLADEGKPVVVISSYLPEYGCVGSNPRLQAGQGCRGIFCAGSDRGKDHVRGDSLKVAKPHSRDLGALWNPKRSSASEFSFRPLQCRLLAHRRSPA